MDGPNDIEVLGAKFDMLDRYWLSLELLKSIRELDSRVDEIKIALGDGPCPGQPERRHKTLERVTRLLELRAKLVYSFMDQNPQYRDQEKEFESCNAFDNLKITYMDLRRQIQGH